MFSRRKRAKRASKKISKEMILSSVLVILLVFVGMGFVFVYQSYCVRANFEKDVLSVAQANEKEVFSFDRIFLFSSSDAIRNENAKSLWDLNIYQYTDIAIYLNNHADNGLTKENTLKQVYLDNISYSPTPEKGIPTVYYKDINQFGKANLAQENAIQDKLDYTIIDGNETIDYTKPTLYTTGNTPITLQYVNKDIKTNAIIPNTNEALTFDGSLLKKSNITLNAIQTTLSFNIHLINNQEEHFVANISIPIPLEDNENNESILNGSIKKEITNLTNYKFYKTNKGEEK